MKSEYVIQTNEKERDRDRNRETDRQKDKPKRKSFSLVLICVCVCVREREKQKDRQTDVGSAFINLLIAETDEEKTPEREQERQVFNAIIRYYL